MPLLEILEFPDPRLRTKAKPVVRVDGSIQGLVDSMLETMYAAPGVGLAATQVNVHKQVIVIDISENQTSPLVFINPEIQVLEGPLCEHQEGCLSVPGYYEMVERPENVLVKALGRDGKAFEIKPEGLLAVCIQHEVDHLKGKLFVDYLSSLKRQRIRKQLEKYHREVQEEIKS
jgi:peptide deformylase